MDMKIYFNLARKSNGRRKYIGRVHSIVKGKKFKNVPIFKILPENRKAMGYGSEVDDSDPNFKGFQYQLGLNVDTNEFNSGFYGSGLYFAGVDDIEEYMYTYGDTLAVLRIPEDEQVVVGYKKYHSHSVIVEDFMSLENEETWQMLVDYGFRFRSNSTITLYHIIKNHIECVLPKIDFAKINEYYLEKLLKDAKQFNNRNAEFFINEALKKNKG